MPPIIRTQMIASGELAIIPFLSHCVKSPFLTAVSLPPSPLLPSPTTHPCGKLAPGRLHIPQSRGAPAPPPPEGGTYLTTQPQVSRDAAFELRPPCSVIAQTLPHPSVHK